ncbi:SH3 domain-containing protein [Kordiimonas lipolytica]|uniref:SH3 domain-containing protein n=1 Tax=Kordiimonas lipolytica TaxID=1662421 RepID=A0ABV8UC00_9PROT|nr:SH3 domain-containing protein [Kordiimonas lipolytica]
MLRFLSILILFSGILSQSLPTHAQTASETPRVGESGQPLPRLISLAASKAFMRTGPGRQYPILWVYERTRLPLEVIDEHRAWRKVRDHEGTTGWMHVSLLSSRRTAMIIGTTRKLYEDPSPASPARLIADAGVIGEVQACDGIWCRLEIDGTEGWIERRYLWGVYEREIID